MLTTMSSSSEGWNRVNLQNDSYVFSLDKLFGQELNKDFEKWLVAKEKLHNLCQRVFKVVRSKLKIREPWCLLVDLIDQFLKCLKLLWVDAIGVFHQVEELLRSLNKRFIVHHSSLSHDVTFIRLGMLAIVVKHGLVLTISCVVVHLLILHV